eukprot:TRINITY_DN13247_c0_g2_i1.p1 TRINITY_DN13247_c0_g2~~TRINITY_DN13247_c0_g2_i1.p1  ORF type:complete len:854 (+),score=169.70 TRINITY_DN13247_c0_g2_i1:66-2564(+)
MDDLADHEESTCFDDFLRVVNAYLDYPVKAHDNKMTKLRKNLFMCFSPAVFLVNIFVFFVIISDLGKVTAAVVVVVSLLVWIHLLVMKTITVPLIQAYIGFLGVAVALYDLTTASENANRAWPLQVMLIDILLVLRAGQAFSKAMVAVVVAYLTLTAVEGAVRFGLFDLPWLASQSARRNIYECSELPCKDVSLAIQNYCAYIMVFLMDYYFTKGFAEQLFQKTLEVEASVQTAEKIAHALAAFDLDEAEQYLNDSGSNLPTKLHDAFEDILKNLTLYRPFLPDALFEECHTISVLNPLVPLKGMFNPPGANADSEAALVFTDIQGSTSIWEACPDGMKRALKIHNKIIRRLIEVNKGYEVKTIGDAFMVAFDTPVNAVEFGLSVQTELLNTAWPGELIEVPLCEKSRDGMWGGLRLRMGVHYGKVDVELDSITGRFDYYGNTVNIAARVEAVSVGGAMAITPEVSTSLSEHYSIQGNTPNYLRLPLGSVSLKGVSKNINIHILIPEKLKGRRPYIEQEVRSRTQRGGTERYDVVRPVATAWSIHSQSDSNTNTESRRSLNIASTPEGSMKRFGLEYLPSVTVAAVDFLVDSNEVAAGADLTNINDKVCRVLHSLDRCSGTVIALLGSMISAGWNTSKATATHFESSLRFTSLLHKMFCNDDDGVHVGMSSGGAAAATIGTQGQRFVTVMGETVKLSMLLASAAAEFETTVLFTSCAPEHISSLMQDGVKGVLRPVATWQTKSPHDKAKKAKTVYEVSVSRLTNIDITNFIKYDETVAGPTGSQNHTWCWTGLYWEAFKEKDSQLIMMNAGADRTAVIAANHLRREEKLVYL